MITFLYKKTEIFIMDDQNSQVNTPVTPQGGNILPVTPVQLVTQPVQIAQAQPPTKGTRKPLLILIILLFLGLVGFGIYKFVVPLITGPKETTVTWWGLWEDKSIVSSLIAEYEATHPGVKIDYQNQSPKDYRERLTSTLAQGKGPDIFRFHNSWVPMFKKDLNSVPADVMNPSDFTQNYYPVIVNDLTTAEGIVGLPLDYDALTLFVNTDIFAQAGKSPPKTWDELRQIAIELTIKDDRAVITQSGVALGRTENVDYWPEILALMILQNGGSLNRPTGLLPQKALEFFTNFSAIDGVWDETLPTSTEAFAAGKLAMYFAPTWRVFEIQQKNPNLKFRSIPLPQVPKDSPSEPNVSYATYWVEGVWNKSPHKEAAWDFLKFMSQKENLEKFYASAASVRGFGEPYPRIDMGDLLKDHEVVGSIITLAPESQSWYLASRTNDGPTGINSQLENYFRDAVNAVNEGSSAEAALETAAAGVNQVLSQYGLVASVSPSNR